MDQTYVLHVLAPARQGGIERVVSMMAAEQRAPAPLRLMGYVVTLSVALLLSLLIASPVQLQIAVAFNADLEFLRTLI